MSEEATPTSPTFLESPVVALSPGCNLLSPNKPICDMTDEELAAWDALQREHITSPQTLQAYIRGPVGKKAAGPKVDISEFQ
jgi:hypothetical protein